MQGISSLGKAQHIRKTTRNEPIRQQDEFQLVKPGDESAARYPVGLHDIVKVLQTTKKHIEAGKQLKVVQSSKRVLDKPLEKPQADRLKRGLGYDTTKKNLGRWDAVVSQNRNAETQVCTKLYISGRRAVNIFFVFFLLPPPSLQLTAFA